MYFFFFRVLFFSQHFSHQILFIPFLSIIIESPKTISELTISEPNQTSCELFYITSNSFRALESYPLLLKQQMILFWRFLMHLSSSLIGQCIEYDLFLIRYF